MGKTVFCESFAAKWVLAVLCVLAVNSCDDEAPNASPQPRPEIDPAAIVGCWQLRYTLLETHSMDGELVRVVGWRWDTLPLPRHVLIECYGADSVSFYTYFIQVGQPDTCYTQAAHPYAVSTDSLLLGRHSNPFGRYALVCLDSDSLVRASTSELDSVSYSRIVAGYSRCREPFPPADWPQQPCPGLGKQLAGSTIEFLQQYGLIPPEYARVLQ